MDENGTDLNSVLNDQPVAEVHNEPTQEPIDQGEQQVEPPATKQQEPDHVPRAALQDERRKRQELEHELRTIREQFMRQQQPQQQAQPEAQKTLKPEQFETYEQYMEAVAEAKAEAKAMAVFEAQMRRMSEAQQAAQIQQQTATDLGDMLNAGRTKYADYDEVVANPSVPISDVMMTAMMARDDGHEVAYHLGRNPAEAARIFRLPPSSQTREIAKLAKTLTAPEPEVPQTKLPKTLTQTRSTDGRFASNQAWNGPAPLDDIFKKRS